MQQIHFFVQRITDTLEKQRIRLLASWLFVTAFVVYIPSLFNGFVWDDTPQIVQNIVVQSTHYITTIFTSSTFYPGTGVHLVGSYYKPLMPFFFMMLHAFFGLNPFFFHLLDILAHAANGVLLFLFFKKMLDITSPSRSKVFAFILSLLFLLHPVNVESVTYISSTQEVFYVFFMLIALLLTFSLKEKQSVLKEFALACSLLFSILSKESGILAFFMVILLSFVLQIHKKKRIIITVIGTLLFYFFLRFGIAHLSPISGNPLIPIQVASFSTRILTIPYEISSYVRLLLFPKDLFIYQDDLIFSPSDPRFIFLFPIAILVLLSLLVLFIRNKERLFRFFIVWVFFSGSLIVNIIPLDMTVAERWMYGPLIGILGALGIWATHNKKREGILTVLILLCIIALPLYILRDVTRQKDWYSNEVLYTHDLQYEKHSARLLNDLGVAFADKKDTRRAEEYFRESLAQAPYQFQAYDNLGLLYDSMGQYDAAKISFITAMGHGALASTYVNYASFLLEHKQVDAAIPFIKRSLLFFPESYELYSLLAIAYDEKGDHTAAIVAKQKANFFMPSPVSSQ